MLYILKGLLIILFRFWYVFLIGSIIWYFMKKFKKKEKKVYRIEDDDKTIEIDKYKIK